MPSPLNFLVVDDNPDSRFLLVRTLLRKFPTAVVQECQGADETLALVRQPEALTAVIVHRATEMTGIAMLGEIRAVAPKTPLVMVSSIDRRDAALAIGADAFLLYDEWLRIGTVVATLMARLAEGRSIPPFASEDPEPASAS